MDNLNTLATLGTDKQSKIYNTELSKDEQHGPDQKHILPIGVLHT
jgi:hypothetical protein